LWMPAAWFLVFSAYSAFFFFSSFSCNANQQGFIQSDQPTLS
jgi:hypothetical protein